MTEEENYEYEMTGLERTVRAFMEGILMDNERGSAKTAKRAGLAAIQTHKEKVVKTYDSALNDLNKFNVHSTQVSEVQSLKWGVEKYYNKSLSAFRDTFDRGLSLASSNEIEFMPYLGNQMYNAEIHPSEEISGEIQLVAVNEKTGGEDSKYPFVEIEGNMVCTCAAKKYHKSPVCKHEIAYMLSPLFGEEASEEKELVDIPIQ